MSGRSGGIDHLFVALVRAVVGLAWARLAEIMRRAERCIGLAMRKGQGEGRIAKQGDIGGNRKSETADDSFCRVTDVSGMGTDELTRGPYAVTDGVTDEAFEDALAEAKAEKNLSRANVVRRVKESAPPEEPTATLFVAPALGPDSSPILIGHPAGMYEMVRIQRAVWWRVIHSRDFDKLPTEDVPHVLDPEVSVWH